MYDIHGPAGKSIYADIDTQWHVLRLARGPAPSPSQENEPFSRIFHVDARFDSAGVWSGVADLAKAAYDSLCDLGAAHLLEAHLLALHALLPQYRDRIHPDHICLTDTAGDAEKTRFHPLNRAYRLVHDLVGLVFQWKEIADPFGRWAIFAWNFDEAQHLGARFFAELARRSLPHHNLDIIVETPSGWSDPCLHQQGLYKKPIDARQAAMASPPQAAARLTPAEMRQLETAMSANAPALLEQNHARLTAYYTHIGDDLAAARVALKTFVLYIGLGYYHEARQMMDRFRPYWEQLIGGDEETCTYHVTKMNTCLVMTDDPAGALNVIEDLALRRLTNPHLLANIHYSLGMHYLRYAQGKDLARAEQHLLRAATLIREPDLGSGIPGDPFKKVFFDNGLAFLRVRQGRPQEALDLCSTGYAYLTAQLGEERHCLHRSVLQYNIAQLHATLGNPDAALEHYGHAIRMDPNYSEYYNEVGNIYQELGDYATAIAAYEEAIKRSAPYPEVYTNKAICHMRQEEWQLALKCFDITLDLKPNQPEACVLRADLLRELERFDEALAGYDAALALGCESAALHVNRAVLHYTNGVYDRALADMERAITLEAQEPSHYENRAAIYRAMERDDLCERDLQLAERCREFA